MNILNNIKIIFNLIWQVSKFICLVLLFSLILNFYDNSTNSIFSNKYFEISNAYELIDEKIVEPISRTNVKENVYNFINNSLNKINKLFIPEVKDNNEQCVYLKKPVVKYFNGITIDEAIISNPQINNTAKQIVGNEKNNRKKAYLIYKWISNNINYNKEKAEIITTNYSYVSSGSIVTFHDKSGICFDYSCLYISMCRAVGLKVRFVTGLAYNRKEWCKHSWNQVFYPEEERWINVDTTFGSSGYNYFDNTDFFKDHNSSVVQYEW